MTSATFSTSVEAQQAAALLEGYHFELGHHDARQWVSLWLEFYRPSWVRDAVVEALYQGRYKSISVRQILEMWNRRGQPIRHVTHDFEAAVCREFGEIKLAPAPVTSPKSQAAKYRSIRRQPRTDPLADPLAGDLPASTPSTGNLNNGKNHLASASPVSFDLSVPMPSPGMHSGNGEERALSSAAANGHSNGHSNSLHSQPSSAANASPDVSSTPSSTPSSTLAAQRQFNGVLYASARAIQPFKPALPFSAQTLRLAKQKALAESALGTQPTQRV